MLELLLALTQAATPAPADLNATPTVVVTGAKPQVGPYDAVVDTPSDDSVAGDFVAIWPRGAYQSQSDGKVMLNCLVDVHGLAERCAVASETPPGGRFGAAALEMRPTFRLKPHMGPGGPVAAVLRIAVTFKAPLPDFTPLSALDPKKNRTLYFRGEPLTMKDVTMVARPVWVAAPSFDDWTKAYPSGAPAGVEGYAVAHCRVMSSGALTECGAVKQDPDGHGFGDAARALAAKFRLDPDLAKSAHTDSLWVDIPIRMPPPGGDRTVDAPKWLVGPDPAVSHKLFPPEAAAAGLTTGRGVALCRVASDGGMTDCAPDPAGSDSPAFADAAARLASAMKMGLWSDDAAPVIGGTVRIGVRLNLKAASGG